MPVSTFSSPETTLTITSAIPIYYESQHVAQIAQRVLTYHYFMPLTRVRFWEIDPNHYRYKVWFVDGREWKQDLYFTGPNDTDLTIDFNLGPNMFKSTEVLYNLEIRSELYNCRRVHGTTDWDMRIL